MKIILVSIVLIQPLGLVHSTARRLEALSEQSVTMKSVLLVLQVAIGMEAKAQRGYHYIQFGLLEIIRLLKTVFYLET